MVAFRGKNLRSGDLAEQLGTVLLQNVSLVAPVPRTEDVGVDVIATLLRDFDSLRQVAEDSFYVQIKSASVRSIEFDQDGVNWLYSLELPFFVASVDRSTASVRLYCAHRLSHAFVTNHERDSLILHLDDATSDDELVSHDDPKVHIGPPVLEWSFATLADDTSFPTTFYQVAKEHITIAKKGILSRGVGSIDLVSWQTNQPPQGWGTASTASRPTHEMLARAEEAMTPYFLAWQEAVLRSGDWTAAQPIFGLLEQTKLLIDSGVMRRMRSNAGLGPAEHQHDSQ